MTEAEKLRHLYFLLSVLPPRDAAAPVLGTLIGELAAAIYPTARRDTVICEFGDRVRFEVDPADRLGRALFYGYVQERQELAIAEAICAPGAHVWDVGANFGLYSVFVGRRVGRSGVVQAFEPDPFARELLIRNVDRNGVADHVAIRDSALSEHDGQGTLFEASESAFTSLRDTERATIIRRTPIRLVRADSLWVELGRPALNLMKIDVEGLEAEVIDGARETILNSPEIVVLFEISVKNLDETMSRRIVASIRALEVEGFRLWQIDPAEGRLRPFALEQDSIPRNFSGNVFLVRRETPRERLLLEAAEAALAAAQPPCSTREASLIEAARTALLSYWRSREASGLAHERRQRDLAMTADRERQLVERYRSEIASLRERHRSEIASLQERHRSEIALLQERHRLEHDEQRAALERLTRRVGELEEYTRVLRLKLDANLVERARRWLTRIRS